jgi:hypothetical protein
MAALNIYLVAARKHMLKRTTDGQSEDANVCDAKKPKQASNKEKSTNTVELHVDTQSDTSKALIFQESYLKLLVAAKQHSFMKSVKHAQFS